MRTLFVAALLAATTLPLSAQQAADVKVISGGQVPAGWTVRFDRANVQAEDLKFERMGQGLHVTSGPAAIFFNPEHRAAGDYTVEAAFTQMRAPEHPEAYGLFIGGSNLDAPNQLYTYFLVRGDGKYSIRHRAAGEVHTIQEWTDHQAVTKQNEEGRATNRLAVALAGDVVSFRVNGTEVASYPRAKMQDIEGQAGLRVNHHLDVHIEGFRIQPGG